MKANSYIKKGLALAKLQFYADLEGHYTNKLFTFKVSKHEHIDRILTRFFDHNNIIRAAFTVLANGTTVRIPKCRLEYLDGRISSKEYDRRMMEIITNSQ